LHLRYDMESCDQGGEDQDEAWLDGPVTCVEGQDNVFEARDCT